MSDAVSASLIDGTIGDVPANNSGDVRCTVKNDAYQTAAAMTFVTASGTIIDTVAADPRGQGHCRCKPGRGLYLGKPDL
ncbi:hypothetical protein ACXU4B_03955 [Dyella soli]|uniref:Uncharacterized protein n=1 Tax=Dyella soli TaxID=522319 RepID=A0A4R0YXF7_9GAMM|nr:hypothetical protein [Dyella soli]TCI10184.1 hypothetical protein EZM97_14840 [Dyella soli]